VTDGSPQRVPAEARAEYAADLGWEPPDWNAVFRRRRLRLWGGAALLLLIAVGIAPLVQTLLDQSPRVSWRWLGLALVASGYAWWTQFTARGRERWERETRREVRIGHALRHHASIGAADRTLVTERAEKIDSLSGASLVGWPLLTALFVVPLVVVADNAVARIGIAAVGLLVGAALVRRNRRRVRQARRWLADPLPRGGSPWT
jgi:hypothetical protein